MGINLDSIERATDIRPLVTFRIAFGLQMIYSLTRFWVNGWITALYVTPKFHFSYWGFEWVRPLDSFGMHLVFAILIAASLLITLGLLYRVAIVVFFLGFTYVELLDVTTYLNHYYFISLVSFLLIWLPANRLYSLDVRLGRIAARDKVPLWTIGILRFQLGVVYVCAGLAKFNADWLLRAEPLKTWLPANSHLPIVGPLMYESWIAYLFAWSGAFYDLLIVFFLLNARTRLVAYVFVIVFHLATALFFPAIGMFPYIMITSTLVFFSSRFHQRLLSFLPVRGLEVSSFPVYRYFSKKTVIVCLAIYMVAQIIIPFRYLLYPGRLFWTEQGYRFSWRVMLVEKAGIAYFTVKDGAGTQKYAVVNSRYLTPLQEKMMATQPDLILKYARFLAGEYKKRGIADPSVYGEIYVTLNGEPSRSFIDPNVNLAREKLSWRHYNWIAPY